MGLKSYFFRIEFNGTHVVLVYFKQNDHQSYNYLLFRIRAATGLSVMLFNQLDAIFGEF